MKTKPTITLPFFLLLSLSMSMGSPIYSQHKVEVATAGIGAIQQGNLSLWNKTVSPNPTFGFDIMAGYRYAFKNLPWSVGLTAGYKNLQLSGSVEGLTYQGQSSKVVTGLNFFYHPTERLRVSTGLGFENNRDFDEFRSQTTDNFRYSFSGEVLYRFWKNLGVFARYNQAISPLEDQYLLYNPAQQLALGLNYLLYE